MKSHWKQWMMVVLFIACFTLFLNVEKGYATTFIDVPENHPSLSEIEFLAETGIIKGYQDKTFKPSNKVTNSQVAIMITRALGLELNNRPDPGFSDLTNIDPDTKKAIAAVVDEGIFPNRDPFRPNEPITRGEMAQVLVNAFHLKGSTNIEFKDVPKTSPYYEAIKTLAANHITTGYEDGTFKPSESLTRAHFSTFISRVINPDFITITTGYGYNKDYNYIYRGNGNKEVVEEYYSYLKTDEVGDWWSVTYENGEGIEYVNKVDKNGFTFIGYTKDDEEVITDMRIPFPVKIGSTWNFSYMDIYDPDFYIVTDVSATIETPAGIFNNLIEIVSSDGYVYYYSPEFGHICTINLENNEAIYELIHLEKSSAE